MDDEALVLGLDVGGTSTRALLASSDGTRRGAGRAGGGNPAVLGAERAAEAVAAAAREALADCDPTAVEYVVAGIAGAGILGPTTDLPIFAQVWERLGVGCPVEYTADALVAFFAGTDEPDGSLLLSGTGAIAIAISERRLVGRADGYGWLLGDRGSGFWLGRQAVLAALADLEGTGPATALTGMVSAFFSHGGQHSAAVIAVGEESGVTRGSRGTTDLVHAAMSRPPIALAELAPLITEACAAADPVAERIADRAASHLLATLSTIREPGSPTPIVLGGSVLIHPTPVAARVGDQLSDLWPRAAVRHARDGAAGATWLALHHRSGSRPAPDIRARMFSTSIANEQNLRTYRAPTPAFRIT